MILSTALLSAAAVTASPTVLAAGGSGPAALAPGGGLLLVAVAVLLYLVAALPVPALRRFSAAALVGGWLLHAVLLVIDIAGVGLEAHGVHGARLGFAPVLSLTVWLVIAVYAVESRLVPLPAVRKWLAVAGIVVVVICAVFPGELRVIHSRLSPLHFTMGVAAYGLFGAAVLHAAMLDSAERRLRGGGPLARAPGQGQQALGMPLLQLEKLTFRFVEAGFAVLTATLILGFATTVTWSWHNHKAFFSVLAWGVFASLLLGRRLRGWRGRLATRWLYAGAGLLLLAYVGSRFVFEVVLGRPPA